MKFNKIFETGKIGNLEIKNRLVVPPMLTEYAEQGGNLSERYIKYYEEKNVSFYFIFFSCIL